MAGPVRLQLSRKKGFRLQELSISTNGLPAVNVARPTKWGNPWKVGDPFYNGDTMRTRKAGMTAKEAVDRYRKFECVPSRSGEIIRELRGKNLACWCKVADQHGNYVPCHADVLLELANRVCEEVS